MRFSCIIPSFLGPYKGAASRREDKIIRAVNSVLDQTFTDFEVQVVADGCQITIDLMKNITDVRVTTTLIEKAPMWSGTPRNTGIDKATGEFIIYLDTDDRWGKNHLQIINDNLKEYDWVYYNDFVLSAGKWIERQCDIHKISHNGTSNICHKRSMGVKWGHNGYGHDFYFNQSLIAESQNYARIITPEYFVMHIPGNYDI